MPTTALGQEVLQAHSHHVTELCWPHDWLQALGKKPPACMLCTAQLCRCLSWHSMREWGVQHHRWVQSILPKVGPRLGLHSLLSPLGNAVTQGGVVLEQAEGPWPPGE